MPSRAEFDLERLEAIDTYVRKVNPALVINCAAYTAVDAAEQEVERATRTNGQAPGSIASAARDIGAGIIHISANYVFEGDAQQPYRENEVCAPVSAYGQSKLKGDEAVMSAGPAHLILRTLWIYAARGKNFFCTMLRFGAECETIRVVNDQTGTLTSAPALAGIIAELVRRMNGSPTEYLARHSGVLNATYSGQTTWHGFAMAIFDETRNRKMPLAVKTIQSITTAQYPTPARRPVYSVLDLTRLRQEFHIVPPPWHATLSDVIAQVKDFSLVSPDNSLRWH